MRACARECRFGISGNNSLSRLACYGKIGCKRPAKPAGVGAGGLGGVTLWGRAGYAITTCTYMCVLVLLCVLAPALLEDRALMASS
jgi:hypothetical protein